MALAGRSTKTVYGSVWFQANKERRMPL